MSGRDKREAAAKPAPISSAKDPGSGRQKVIVCGIQEQLLPSRLES